MRRNTKLISCLVYCVYALFEVVTNKNLTFVKNIYDFTYVSMINSEEVAEVYG